MPRKPKPRERTNETLLLMAYGAEEMETVIIIDILRRAGVSVRVAGENEIVTCSRGVKIIPDVLFDDVLDRGAGTAIEFALTLVEVLADGETKDRIAKDIVYNIKRNDEVENAEETEENLPI
ncbi:MAG: DJ-1/PfpI family protein [Ignavibacteriae bacterium]|nr:DJ-1/PfpI family protein [Ignavibacteriota bacterium]